MYTEADTTLFFEMLLFFLLLSVCFDTYVIGDADLLPLHIPV